MIAGREHARHERRRGRRFAYESLDARRTALVVVDLVPFFVQELDAGGEVCSVVNHLAAAVRAAGGSVAWVVPAAGEPSAWSIGFHGPEVAALYAGSAGAVDPALRVEPSDVVVEKSSASAFFPGRCSLAERLDERSVENVVVAGAVTSVCVESTARDAATLGYRVVLAADACIEADAAAHAATLRTVYRSFGDVRSAAEVVTLLR